MRRKAGRHVLFVLIMILILGLSISACTSSKTNNVQSKQQKANEPTTTVANPPAGSAATAKSKETPQKAPRKIKISISSTTFSFLPAKVAQEQGFFKQQGLDMELVTMRPDAGIAALTSGDIDYTMTFGTTLEAILKGMPLRVMAVITAKTSHYLVARPEYKSVKDLVGKTVGVNKIRGTGHIAAIGLLRSQGVDPDQVKYVSIGESLPMIESMKKGVIDAASLEVPWPLQLQREGYQILATPKDQKYAAPSAGITTTMTKIKNNPAEIKGTIKAVLQGLDYMARNEEGTVKIMMDWLSEDVATARDSYKLLMDTYAYGTIPQDAMEEALKERAKNAEITELKPISEVVDFGLVQEVQKELNLH